MWASRAAFTGSPPRPGRLSPRRHRWPRKATDMADFLVVAGIVAFIGAMLALIWGLERV
jgi:hypothetical protein